MAIALNKNTTQAQMQSNAGVVVQGRTGLQSIKFIPAPRVYVKTADPQTATVVPGNAGISAKSNGATPTGWTDLGSVVGNAKVTFTQKVKDITTGIDNYYRGSYINGKMATLEADLGQLDDVVLEQISGISASVIQSGSVVSYHLGSKDLNQLALLMVVQNKFDSKEWQFYNPNAFINFTFSESGDALTLKMTGQLPFFTAAADTAESMLACTMFV